MGNYFGLAVVARVVAECTSLRQAADAAISDGMAVWNHEMSAAVQAVEHCCETAESSH